MDRDRAIGIILLMVVVGAYFYFAPSAEPTQTNTTSADSTVVSTPGSAQPTATLSTAADSTLNTTPDSVQLAAYQSQYGVFAPAATGSRAMSTIETPLATYTLSNQGGQIVKTVLKEFKDYKGDPLVLFSEGGFKEKETVTADGRTINLSALYFDMPAGTITLGENDSLNVEARMDLGNGRYLSKTYTFLGSSYVIGLELKSQGIPGLDQGTISYDLANDMPKLESDIVMSRQNSTVQWYSNEDGFDYLTERSTSLEEERIDESLHWLVFKQRFFHIGFIGDDANLQNANVSSNVNEADTTVVKHVTANFQVPAGRISEGLHFRYYLGPNDYYLVSDVAEGYNNNVDLGWFLFAGINKILVIPIFKFLEQYIANYGIIILILVLIVKLLLSPLAYKSYVSMAKQKVLKPEIDRLKEKHDGDMQAIQSEQMELFRKAGVNPLSGCIPLLLQFPILLALFNFFPNSIELRQEGFLWAHDLSTYDSIMSLPFEIPFYGDHVSLFTLLMTASTLVTTRFNNQVSTVDGPMKYMGYMMPIIFMFVLNSFSAALTFYYFVSNIITIAQQYVIKTFIIDEKKVKAVIEENKKKNANKQKSGWRARLDEAMKASQEQAKQNQQGKQGKKKGKK